MCLFLKTKLESSDKRKQGKTSEYPPQNPQSRFALFHRLPRMTFVLCSPMLFQMFQGPTTRCAFVVCCKGCKENIPAPVETLPSSWIAAKCPLCGEHRQYLPTEIFQGRVSYLALRKPVRAVTRSNDVWPPPERIAPKACEKGRNTMPRTRRDPKSFDQTYLCSACGYRIPPRELLRVDGVSIRCPKCKAEKLSETHKPQTTS